MPECESVLLERFVSRGDAGAFSEIVRRHAGLVYGTCMRVLADADRAADATQETFYQLVKKADRVTESIPGWLHRVAVRQATDLIRSDSRRRRREQAYVQGQGIDDPTWRQICPHVDEALAQLDDQTRDLLVRHYMEGTSMEALARESGLSRSTIHRRIDAGLKNLRLQLHKQGLIMAAGGLATLLAENTAQGAPTALVQQIGKITLVGAKVAATSTSAATGLGVVLAAAKTKLIAATVIAVVASTAVVVFRSPSGTPPTSGPVPPAVSRKTKPGRPSVPDRGRSTTIEKIPTVAEQLETSPQVSEDKPTVPTSVVAEEPDVTVSVPPAGVSNEPQEAEAFDLSSPQATARSFIRAIVAGDADAVMACFLPDGEDYDDMLKMLHANPANPDQRSDYEARCLFDALDPDAEMPMLSTEQTERGTSVRWQVTFKHAFTIEGHTFNAGDTMDFDGTMCQSGDTWLIVSL